MGPREHGEGSVCPTSQISNGHQSKAGRTVDITTMPECPTDTRPPVGAGGSPAFSVPVQGDGCSLGAGKWGGSFPEYPQICGRDTPASGQHRRGETPDPLGRDLHVSRQRTSTKDRTQRLGLKHFFQPPPTKRKRGRNFLSKPRIN